MAVVNVRHGTLGVVLVLNFHTCVPAHIYVVSEVLACSYALCCEHVQIECAIGLILAVLDASALCIVLNKRELVRHAILMALVEEEARESIRLQRLSLVRGVLCPIRHT